MIGRSNLWLAALASFAPSPVFACTLCHSRLAEDVRAAVLGPDFWTNLSALALPAPILVAAVIGIRRWVA